jgi:hypothetical protein
MAMDDKRECAACGHAIDAAARICPYCGADPASGEKGTDTQALLQEVFHPRPQLTASESVLEYARHRQGIVVVIALIVAFLILAGLHQFVTARNSRDVSNNPAVPLTEITDLSAQQDEAKQLPLPPMEYQHDGRPQAMRTFILEPGAVTPPEVTAAQQAQALAEQQAAAQKAGAHPPGVAPGVTPPPAVRPQIAPPAQPQRATAAPHP